jgi:hypothetical protein
VAPEGLSWGASGAAVGRFGPGMAMSSLRWD